MMSNRASWAVATGATALLLVVAIALGLWLPRQFGTAPQPGSVDLASIAPETAARYRFAEAHQDLAAQLPCYCGCGPTQGHRNLLDCFIKPPGYNDHAVACTVCGHIAQDAENLLAAGQDVATIRARIDEQYRELGPPTRPQ